MARLSVEVDEGMCRAVAARFERLPLLTWNRDVARRYQALIEEARAQYKAVLGAGIVVEPWLGPGQPYRDSRELVGRVCATGVIDLFLTRSGHGPRGSAGFHPLREPSGVTVRGVELTHNDLFRVAHDVFGHVMFANSFGLAGELKAAYCQMALFSGKARPVVFAEQVAQTCWFFFGPHRQVPPHRRTYPEQKVFAGTAAEIEGFERMFRAEEAA
jgi:hypothetical protein